MAGANLAALAERLGINTLVDKLNREDELDMDAHRIELYYDQMMLDKIKISQDEYVYLRYAKPYTMPKGHEKWTIRRSFPLTEHTVPLLEGIPPASDKTKKERIEGIFHQYGRYMEFSDRVEWKLLDPIIMEYAQEYGDVAVRTMQRLARQEMLNTTMKVYAQNRANLGELQVGDTVGLAEFRLTALKLHRLLVRPIDGMFHVITSEEHYWDLMKDDLILEYLGSNNGIPHYKDGSLPELFGIKFIKTQFDDYHYGYELANPGEWLDGSTATLRVYTEHPCYDGSETGDGSTPYLYANITSTRTYHVAEEYKEDTDDVITGHDSRSDEIRVLQSDGSYTTMYPDLSGATTATETHNRLSDGSWIPIRVRWTWTNRAIHGVSSSITLTQNVSTETQIDSSAIYYKGTYDASSAKDTVTLYYRDGSTYEELGTLEAADNTTHVFTAEQMEPLLPEFKQLPVHKAIMLGQDALAQLEVTGEGNVKMYAKQKGSAGVLDPIDQRQSIGFKINTIGFKLVREEACWVFYHVPTQAPATAGLNITPSLDQANRPAHILAQRSRL